MGAPVKAKESHNTCSVAEARTSALHERVLPLGALCWAVVGRDPGFTPLSLLELLKRRGHHRPEDFNRRNLVAPLDLTQAKARWLAALDSAEEFVRARPPEELGCLYYDATQRTHVVPGSDTSLSEQGITPHFGAPGGVVPRIADAPLAEGFPSVG